MSRAAIHVKLEADTRRYRIALLRLQVRFERGSWRSKYLRLKLWLLERELRKAEQAR